MKKIKISELPICSTLKGLFTIGVDAQNRSVKVSLQFVEDKTNEAVTKANTATEAANTAKKNADTATSEAKKATEAAKTATSNAEKATSEAKTATTNASNATDKAQKAASEAQKATEASNSATDKCNAATAASNEATEASRKATSEAKAATEETLMTMRNLVPSALTVEQPPRITWGNVNTIRIKAVLSPVTVLKNLIYISDNRAVIVSTDGRITPVAKGQSVVHVIPTCNTALAKTLLVEVGDPTLRLHTRTQLRFTQGGGLRLN